MATTPPFPPLSIQCRALGARLIAPAMTPAAICARFVGKIDGASVAPAGALRDGLAVELRFLPRGHAMASVTRFQAGKPEAQQLFELTVFDREFQPGDVDRLAADVAAGMASAR